MPDVPLARSDYFRGVAKEARIRTRNRYFEVNPVLTDTQSALISRPGMRRWHTVGDGPVRGVYSQPGAFDGDLFVASGTEIYRVAPDKTTTLTYSDYSTTSWFEVTVRNKATGEVVLQDGFGAAKGYPAYVSRTLKVLKSGDLVVEFNGNDVRASVNVWIKPHGNVEESRMMEFTRCAYLEGSRDSLAAPTQTTVEGAIYTWTPENQVTK